MTETAADPKICRLPHPRSGLRCGLYEWHRQDGSPHQIVRKDYPYSRTVQQGRIIKWSDTRQSLNQPKPTIEGTR